MPNEPDMTTKMTDDKVREEIINDIQRFVGGQREYAERMADWIIERDKKILAPLAKAINSPRPTIKISYTALLEGIDETLKLAGVKDD